MNTPAFSSPDLFDWLLEASDADLDALEFGVIELDDRLVCHRFNAHEQRKSGLSKERVIGKSFFDQVAPCMNNFMVADRLEDTGDLDETIPYTLSIKVTPTVAQLRMLARAGETRRFLVLQWSDEP